MLFTTDAAFRRPPERAGHYHPSPPRAVTQQQRSQVTVGWCWRLQELSIVPLIHIHRTRCVMIKVCPGCCRQSRTGVCIATPAAAAAGARRGRRARAVGRDVRVRVAAGLATRIHITARGTCGNALSHQHSVTPVGCKLDAGAVHAARPHGGARQARVRPPMQ